MLARDQYADLSAVPDAVVMERLGEYQELADSERASEEDLKDQAKEHRKTWERQVEKMAMLHRARKAGKTIRMLRGGELTDEEPEGSPNLFDGQASDASATQPVETPTTQAPAAPVEDDPPLAVHTAVTSKNERAVVQREDGRWYGRLAGKPCAIALASSKGAKEEVEKVAGEPLTWTSSATPPPPAV